MSLVFKPNMKDYRVTINPSKISQQIQLHWLIVFCEQKGFFIKTFVFGFYKMFTEMKHDWMNKVSIELFKFSIIRTDYLFICSYVDMDFWSRVQGLEFKTT